MKAAFKGSSFKILLLMGCIAFIISITALSLIYKSPESQISNQKIKNPEPEKVEIPNEPVKGTIILSFKPEITEEQKQEYINSIGGEIESKISGLNSVVVKVPENYEQTDNINSEILTATEPDYYVAMLEDPASTSVEIPNPNDPRFSEQWSLNVIKAKETWSLMTEEEKNIDKKIAVIDSGICANHEDLNGKILPGFDFVENDSNPQDELGHGCGVSGIIAANINNEIGIAGVSANAKIIPLKVLDKNGIGTYSNVASAIIWAVDNGAEVINISLGGSNSSTLLENAINYAKDRNVIVVAASGNTGTQGVLYPAAYEYVIGVGSLDENLERSSFTSFGAGLDTLAPGRNILTTSLDGGYKYVSGTSFAAPIVSGTGIDNSITYVQETNYINEEVEDSTVSGQDSSYRLPFVSTVTNFGNRPGYPGATHHGKSEEAIDFNLNPEGGKVLAIADAEVVYSKNTGSDFGETVVLDHFNGEFSIYAHLKSGSRKVAVGEYVLKGQMLGLEGGTGNSQGDHLHFEVRSGMNIVNNTLTENDLYNSGSPVNVRTLGGMDLSIPKAVGESRCEYYYNNMNNSGEQFSYRYKGIMLFPEYLCDSPNNYLYFVPQTNPEFINISNMGFGRNVRSIHVAPGKSLKIYESTTENGNGGVLCVTGSMWDLSQDKYSNGSEIVKGDYGNQSSISAIKIYNNSNCSDQLSCSGTGGAAELSTLETNSCGGGNTGNPATTCQGRPNGKYCGQTLGLTQSKLYKCSNGSSSEIQACTSGCSVQAQGTDDFCLSQPVTQSCPNNQNGNYCGKAFGSGYEQESLYSCNSGTITKLNSCSLGCLQKPPGTNDVCKTSESGTGTGNGRCPSNGLFCGSTLGLNSNNLYKCNNNAITLESACNSGCELKPAGTPDACYPTGSGNGGSSGDKVKVYQDSGLTGAIRVEADSDTNEPYRGAPYKSIYIPSGWSIILRDKDLNLVGHEECFSSSIQNLESHGGWSSSLESIKIFKTNVCPVPNTDSWVKICKVNSAGSFLLT